MSAPAPQLTGSPLEPRLTAVVKQFLIEAGRDRLAETMTRNSSFERDLGFSSLDLVELVLRIESALDVELPDDIADRTDTVASWTKAIEEGAEDQTAHSAYRIVPPAGDPPPRPVDAETLVEVLRRHADVAPARIHVHMLEEGNGQAVTYAGLLERATVVARGLFAAGLKRNETVGILLPNGTAYMEAFFGIQMAGGVPVPIHPPADARLIADYVSKQTALLKNAGIRYLISFERVRPISRLLRVKLPELRDVLTVEELRDLGKGTPGRLPEPSEIAVIQYTSGSTGQPKGAVLTHASILANIVGIGEAMEVRPTDAVVSWLPLASDLGLVGCWMFSLYHGIPMTLLSPQEFLERPESWLWAIHDSRGTLSAAPNFAYEMCARRVPMWAIQGMDLSCWRVAVNAGETVLPETVERFCRRFAPVGLDAAAMTPCYGLSENSVALAVPPPGRGVIRENEAFSVGRPLPNHEVRVVDDEGQPVAQGVTGRLQFRGPSQCAGYYRDPQMTGKLNTADGWKNTGDLAFLKPVDGTLEVFFAGRADDVINIEGRLLAPETVEGAVKRVPGVLADAVACFAQPDASRGTSRLIVAVETKPLFRAEIGKVKAGAERAAIAASGVRDCEVVMIPGGTLPKTNNGKLRRSTARAMFADGSLGAVAPSPSLQMAGLWYTHSGALARRAFERGTRALMGRVAGWTARRISGAAVLWHSLSGSTSHISKAAALALRVLGRTVQLRSTEISGPRLFVASRASRFDALALAAVAKGAFVFGGRETLAASPAWVTRLLEPLVAGDRAAMDAALAAGKSLVVLPDSSTGVSAARSRFRLPPLEAAIAANAPVVPVGSRQFRSRLVFRAGEPLKPGATARDLRDQVRSAVGGIFG